MSAMVDIFNLEKIYTLDFKLPIYLWDTIEEKIKETIKTGWQTIKYLNSSGKGLSEEFNQLPDNCGGIYVFNIQADIIPDVHKYIMYIGRARKREEYSLKKRCRGYLNDNRPKVANMVKLWGEKLYLTYLPISESDEVISLIESELLRVIRPPCNTQLPRYTIDESVPLF